MGHRRVDPPADGRRAVRRLHLAPRPPPGRRTGRDDTNETEVARVLDELLTRAEHGPADKVTRPGRRPHPCRRSRAPATAAEDARRGNAGTTSRTAAIGRPVDGDPVRGLRRRRRSREVDMSDAPPTAGRAPTPTPAHVDADDPLTTKEGWRRFVDHQPEPPALHAARSWRGCRRASGPPTTRPAAATTPTCRW